MSGRLSTGALAIVTAAASLALAGKPDASGTIAFLRLTGSFWQVWEMDPDGAAARQLTRTPVDKVMTAWRPSSRELLYHTQAGETFVLDTTTGKEKRLLEGLFVTDAAWSPDGKKLAYGLPPTDLVKGKTALWMSGLQGEDRRQLAGGPGVDALAPSWLPDGASLLYRQCTMRSYIEVNHDFWALKPGGDVETRCQIAGDDEPLKFDQGVSSEGVIAYSSARTGHYEIWTNAPGRSPARQVTRLGAYAGNPAWSPDGSWIVFDSQRDGIVQLYKVRPDGSGVTRLTSGDAPSRKPAWGPRSGRVAGVAPNWCAPASAAAAPARDGAAAGTNHDHPATAAGGLSISWVSLDRPSFEPVRDEQVTLRFRLSEPARVAVRFLDGDGKAVRTIEHTAAAAGQQEVRWDGKDGDGRVVPPEAYAYTITATGTAGEVTYDLRAQSEGEMVWPRNLAVDPATGRVSYTLPQASRVRLMISRQDTTSPIRTLVDWAPREEGDRVESWDGWDEARTRKYLDVPLLPLFYAFSLPRNAVIVNGPAGAVALPALTVSVSPAAAADAGHKLYLHARHPRAACYNPRLSLSLPEVAEKTPEGVPVISKATPLRVEAAAEQPAGGVKPLPRLSVFLYADGVMVERSLSGYAPYQWVVDPARLGPGEHVITALLAWRDDHFGIGHIKVRVGPQHSAAGPTGGGL